MRRVCCVAHTVERAGAWEPVAIFSANELVTHGSCPECFDETMAEMDGVAEALVAGGLTLQGWAAVRGQGHRCG